MTINIVELSSTAGTSAASIVELLSQRTLCNTPGQLQVATKPTWTTGPPTALLSSGNEQFEVIILVRQSARPR